MILDRNNVIKVVKSLLNEEVQEVISDVQGETLGTLHADLRRCKLEIRKNHKLRVSLIGCMYIHAEKYTFYPKHFWVDVNFINRKAEDVKTFVLSSLVPFILTSFTRVKTSAARCYYHFDSIDGPLSDKNGADQYPNIDDWANSFYHHRLMLDYVKGRPDEMKCVALGAGHLTHMFNLQFKVKHEIPKNDFDNIRKFLLDSRYSGFPEHTRISADRLIVFVDIFAKGRLYSTNSTAIEKVGGKYVRVTKDCSSIHKLVESLMR